MQALVPAAGEGTRLRPLTADRPKGLVEVAGRPLLAHVFESLGSLPVDEIVVVIGYEGEMIRDRFGAEFEGTPLTYVEQPDRRGLAHAVELASSELDGDFLLHNGDNVCDANLDVLVAGHREADAIGTALVESVSTDRAARGGVFDLDPEGDVVGLVEKPPEPPSTMIPRGVWALDRRVTHACALVTPGHTGERELSDAVDLCLSAGWALETVELDGWCRNVNTAEDVRAVERRLV
jgi:glucose-1-phosphate thymidylyltransferase